MAPFFMELFCRHLVEGASKVGASAARDLYCRDSYLSGKTKVALKPPASRLAKRTSPPA